MVIWEYHSKARYIIYETLRKVTHNPETGLGLNIPSSLFDYKFFHSSIDQSFPSFPFTYPFQAEHD